jgi:multidrug resistance efflux pump
MNEEVVDMKPGYKTTEFWITVIVNLAAAVVAILAARGLIAADESSLWIALAQAVAVAVAPIVAGIVTKSYVDGRSALKLGQG